MVEFVGGEDLVARLTEIAKSVSKAASVEIGFLEGATEANGVSVPMIAAIQEFGAPNVGIPPRPFFRTMIAAKSEEWPEAIAELLKANDFDAAKTLDQTGAAIAGQLRQSIVDTSDPPLSPVTLMLRKMRADEPGLIVTGKTVGEAAARVAAGEDFGGVSTKPLVDSGVLLNSIDHIVK